MWERALAPEGSRPIGQTTARYGIGQRTGLCLDSSLPYAAPLALTETQARLRCLQHRAVGAAGRQAGALPGRSCSFPGEPDLTGGGVPCMFYCSETLEQRFGAEQ